ncbi:hypothetical protein AB5J49_16985 [Streptomyces sp. R28]|uniref:Uncharacterized protein n=1 Tax=Streptomyces sp. R28 TaxID=3238628 RepID=A0AB39Q0F3_9ACTN
MLIMVAMVTTAENANDDRPVKKAWLIHAKGHSYEDAFADLAKAAEKVDAEGVVGVRLVVDAGPKSAQWCAYRTAEQYGPYRIQRF